MTTQPPGWYPAEGDPPGTHRYWDGAHWATEPQPISPPDPGHLGGQMDANPTGPAPGQYGSGMGGPAIPGQTSAQVPGQMSGQPAFPGQPGFGGQPAGYPMVPASGRELTQPWSRVAARAIDGVIFWLISMFIGLVFVAALLGDVPSIGVANRGQHLVGMFVALAYEAGFVLAFGATPGKLLLGMEVVGESDGLRAEPTAALIRGLVWAASRVAGAAFPFAQPLVGLIVIIAGLVLLFTDPRHQSLADKAAKTVVVQR